MKKAVVVFCLVAGLFCFHLIGCEAKNGNAVETIKGITAYHIDGLKNHAAGSLLPLVQRRSPLDSIRNAFLQTRLRYKRIEWAAEYFMGNTTRLVNGPPVPEIETEENKITAPEGLQVMEGLLFATDSIDYEELQRQTKLLLSHCAYYRNYWDNLQIDSAQVFDAVRLQLFRIATLGITGFDAPLAKSGIAEAEESVKSAEEVLNVFDEGQRLRPLFSKAKTYLNSHADFDSFDRLAFIKECSEPLTKGLAALQKELNVPYVTDWRLLRTDAGSLFEKGVFNVNAYTQDSSYWTSPQKAALGNKLFYDPVLSANNGRSCATCHQPQKAFTDGLATSAAIAGSTIRRNAPTLLNAALQPSQFYDMRTTNLENQSRDVIHNKAEMHGNLSEALKEIVAKPEYESLLKQAFPKATAFTEQHLQNALASYVRSLAVLNSRFDNYMRGESGVALSEEEKAGFNLFAGKARCATCHFLPLFNGTVPPGFLEMESEVIGVPAMREGKSIDNDSGRYALYKLPPFLRAFKTTTARNAALTAPYMHNGVFNTLEEVIHFYDKGGGAGMGLTVPGQTLAPEPLNLSAKEKAQLIAFLRSLTDERPAAPLP